MGANAAKMLGFNGVQSKVFAQSFARRWRNTLKGQTLKNSMKSQ